MCRVSVCVSIGGVECNAEGRNQRVSDPLNLPSSFHGVFLFNVKAELGKVFSERIRYLRFFIALDINVGNRWSVPIPTIIQTKVPMPISIKRNKTLKCETDMLLTFIPVEAG